VLVQEILDKQIKDATDAQEECHEDLMRTLEGFKKFLEETCDEPKI
jgi:hypothetical protein